MADVNERPPPYNGVREAQEEKNVENRGAWGGKLEFILTCVGYAVGLGNVWRFPYLTYQSGGGAFLIPYVLMLLFVGLPIFFFELAFGQFASLGPMAIWTVTPIFKGIGMGMLMVSFVMGLYYQVVISYCVYFFFASMAPIPPWTYCDNPWNTEYCLTSPEMKNQTILNKTLTARNMTREQIKSPSEEFFYREVLKLQDDMGTVGGVVWQLALCLLIAWIFVYLVLVKGIRSLGKVVYFTSTFPYIMLTIMVVRGATLTGAGEGVKFYLEPNVARLGDASVWSDAATQIFYSLSACSGGLIAMSSYNQFKNNVYRDSLLIPFINCGTSFYAGFAIFSVLGFMAHEKGVQVEDVATQGPGLVFVVYPEGISQMPLPTLWAILFFFMMMMLGFSSQFSIVESVFVAVMDEFPGFFRANAVRPAITRGVCIIIFYLISLPMVCTGGFYLFSTVDAFVSGFPLLFIGFFELVSVLWVYGLGNFCEDVALMLGKQPNIFFKITWVGISPLILFAVIIFKVVQYAPPDFNDRVYPDWMQLIGWLIVTATVIFIPTWMMFYWCYRGGWRALKKAAKPLPSWGPAKKEDRTGKYEILDKTGKNAGLYGKEEEMAKNTHINTISNGDMGPRKRVLEHGVEGSYENKGFDQEVNTML